MIISPLNGFGLLISLPVKMLCVKFIFKETLELILREYYDMTIEFMNFAKLRFVKSKYSQFLAKNNNFRRLI